MRTDDRLRRKHRCHKCWGRGYRRSIIGIEVAFFRCRECLGTGLIILYDASNEEARG